MDVMMEWFESNEINMPEMGEWKVKPICTCLIGTYFSVTDPWCPEHRVVMDFSGFVSTDLAED